MALGNTNDYKQEFAARLVQAMEEKGFVDTRTRTGVNFTALSEVVGVSPAIAYRYVTANALPRKKNLQKIAEWLGVNPSWLEYGISLYSIPVLSWEAAHFLNKKAFKQAREKAQHFIKTQLPENPDIFALQLEDDSWAPILPKGAHIILRCETLPQTGDLALVMEPDKPLLFGMLKKQLDRYYLQGRDEKLPAKELHSDVMLIAKYIGADFTAVK